MGDKRIVMTLTSGQLALIQDALEEHFRLRMGQAFSSELADDLAFQNIDLPNDDPAERERIFDAAIKRRNAGVEKLEEFIRICLGYESGRYRKTDAVQNEIDMWATVRHWRWQQSDHKSSFDVRSDPVFLTGTEPALEIEWENDEP